MVAMLRPELPAFKRMQLRHVDAVVEIEAAAYEFPWSRSIFIDCLRAGYAGRVLVRGEQVIGYGMLSAAAQEAHILNVCVVPAEQGQGLGRRLVAQLLQMARWHRSERVFLEVRPSNAIAIALYQSIGFNQIGRRPNYYPARKGREDALVMAMELLPDAEA
ncbi:ribosomal protein S18-alanine N-acetyltransferase [Dokdonella sp.]|uniref:ribosomal protein S18-alanine N-acetyltransferase n=1 Tax=Dokdonella sp. TaxID=2291710 RepID=UPI0031C14301|nr:ribosomal protein S18-alanine N-acetyltransferase [Dokdonella sp.]